MSILKTLSCALSLLMILACGGNGSKETTPSIAMSLSTEAVTVSTSTQPPTLTTATVDIVFSGPLPPGRVYLHWDFTKNGIDSVQVDSSFAPKTTMTIKYKSPEALAIGTYSDTITLVASTDQAGIHKIANSPRTINSTYKVLLPPSQVSILSPTSAWVGGPAFTMTITGEGFVPGIQLQWDGTPMPTTYVSDTTLTASIPAKAIAAAGTAHLVLSGPDVAPSRPVNFIIGNAQASFIQLPAADIAWDGLNQRIYAAIPNITITGQHNNTLPNTIAAIDPVSGQVVRTVSTGTDRYPSTTGPIGLAISDDSRFLYAYTILHDADAYACLQRYNLPALTLDSTFKIPFNNSSPSAISVAPGAPHTVALALLTTSGGHKGIVVFDDSTQRGPMVLESKNGSQFNSLAWSPDASTLFAAGSTGEFMTLKVHSGGLEVKSDEAPFLSPGSKALHYVSSLGRMYVANGQVIDPAVNQVVGTCGTGWQYLAPDPLQRLGFFLGESASFPEGGACVSIHAYDLSRYAFISQTTIPIISIPNTYGFMPNKIIRCGPSTLALSGGLGPISLLKGPFAEGK